MYNNTYNSHITHISCNIQECEWQVLGITLRTRRLCWSLRSRTECDSFVLQTCEIWCSLHFLVVDYKHCSYWILLICVRNHHTHIIYIHIIHIYIYVCVSCTTTPQLPIHGAFHCFGTSEFYIFCCKICFCSPDPHDLNKRAIFQVLSETPGAQQTAQKFPQRFSDYPRKPTYFDVYSPTIKTLQLSRMGLWVHVRGYQRLWL